LFGSISLKGNGLVEGLGNAFSPNTSVNVDVNIVDLGDVLDDIRFLRNRLWGEGK
jgi:hypothetical protein